MRTKLRRVLAAWLVSASLLALPAVVSAAGADLAGSWVSVDSDGSTQTLVIGRGDAPAVTYQDFFAGTCAEAGFPSTHFVATGRASFDGGAMLVDFRDGGCGLRKLGPFALLFGHDAVNDTLTDEFGITWYRSR